MLRDQDWGCPVILHAPFEISARLLPALRVGSDSWISIQFDGASDGRAVYRYFIDAPGLEYEGNDLKSGRGGGSLQSGMAALLSYLGAAVESYRYRGLRCTGDPDDNSSLFPPAVVEWAYQNDMALQCLELDLTENPELLED